MIAVALSVCSYGSISTRCNIYVYIYLYMYVYINVCVCVCERESNDERVPDDRRGIDGVLPLQHLDLVRYICIHIFDVYVYIYLYIYVCMYVCMCVCVWLRVCV